MVCFSNVLVGMLSDSVSGVFIIVIVIVWFCSDGIIMWFV